MADKNVDNTSNTADHAQKQTKFGIDIPLFPYQVLQLPMMILRDSRRFSSTLLSLCCCLSAVFWVCPNQRRGSLLLVDSAVTDGRHSYSLTTFDPNGKLGQVERAMMAASMGTPIVGVIKGNDIILASPQILPSPLMNDDGTSRFAVASPQIILGQSGIASDGRVVVESAQRLAIEHSYTYDEPIPIGLFLEELSLLFQAYTMKPGARPFGCTLLVGYLPPPRVRSATQNTDKPRLFKIDCSGAVVELDTIAVINGKFKGDINSRLLDFSKLDYGKESIGNSNDHLEKDRELISRILQEGLQHAVTSRNKQTQTKSSRSGKSSSRNTEDVIKLPLRIISASFDRVNGFEVERRMVGNGSDPTIRQ